MPESQDAMMAAITLLSKINKLLLKSFGAKDEDSLAFVIVNETVQATRYDRAILWDLAGKNPELLAVSGHSKVKTNSDLADQWKMHLKNLKNPEKIQEFTENSFDLPKEVWENLNANNPDSSVLWIPIKVNNKIGLGLWLERWAGEKWATSDIEILNPLMEGYGLAYSKFKTNKFFDFWRDSRVLLALGLFSLLFFSLRIPLRVVAPCEVVPKDIVVITAPLEEIISEVLVKAGQRVKPNDLLFEYDKRVPSQNLKIAEEQLRIARQDLERAQGAANKDERSFADLGVLAGKVKKEKANYELANYKASQLSVTSPVEGIVMIDDPDQWRGKPVHVGEKIMSLTSSDQTKVRFWIPESDNIVLDYEKPISVVLNIDPLTSREAKISFISNAVILYDNKTSSFMGEAEWVNPQKDVKFGLKGTAILYGENVSLFYWIIRKPWSMVRNAFGF